MNKDIKQQQTKLAYIAKSLSRGTNKKYETFVINEIYSRLNNPELEIKTQQRVNTTDGEVKYIDLYFPQLKIAVEVDEEYHDNDEQRKRDIIRENSIKLSDLESTLTEKEHEIRFERVEIISLY